MNPRLEPKAIQLDLQSIPSLERQVLRDLLIPNLEHRVLLPEDLDCLQEYKALLEIKDPLLVFIQTQKD